jgi:hypothetical protein
MRKAPRSVGAGRAVLMSAAVFCLALTSSTSAQGSSPAADPIIGTWKLNPAATKVSPGMPFGAPAQRTEIYTQNDSGQMTLVVTTSDANGSMTSSTLRFSARGGVVTQENAPPGPMLIETRIAPGEWRVTYLANGVQLLTMQKIVSGDGKTMRQTMTGMTPQGTSFEGLLVFDRQ